MWLSICYFCCLLHLFCCTPKKFIIFKHMSRVYAPFLFFFCFVKERNKTVLVCVFVCVRVSRDAGLHLVSLLIVGCVQRESPCFLCRHAFKGSAPFLWNVRSDLTVCSHFPALWKRWWAISWSSCCVRGRLVYWLYIRVARLGGSECACFRFVFPLACEQSLFRR